LCLTFPKPFKNAIAAFLHKFKNIAAYSKIAVPNPPPPLARRGVTCWIHAGIHIKAIKDRKKNKL
jgi:hypothetical protein